MKITTHIQCLYPYLPVLLVALLAACGNDKDGNVVTKGEDGGCTESVDCESGHKCMGSKCVSSRQTDDAGLPATPQMLDCGNIRPIEVRTNSPVPTAVAVAFVVEDCNGTAITSLDSSNFKLYEDDKPVSPAESSFTMIHRDAELFVSLVLDESPSVKDSGVFPKVVAAAREYVERVMTSQSVYVGLWTFGKSIRTRQFYTTDKAAVLAAIDGIEKNEKKSRTTNFYGAVVDILNTSRISQEKHRHKMKDGITTLGQILLFTDASDQASSVSFVDAAMAVSAASDDVLVVALGGEIDSNVAQHLGKDGAIVGENPDDISKALNEATVIARNLQDPVYVLGYCSPKLLGAHKLRIEVKIEGLNPIVSQPISYDASGFDASDVQCSAVTFQNACVNRSCGSLLCGSCGPKGRCAIDDKCFNPCGAKLCGPDGFGDSCGTCAKGLGCVSGKCIETGEMILIPAGPFWMGTNTAIEPPADPDETPYHEVTLDTFYIDKTEVTQSQYKKCVDAGSCKKPTCNWNPDTKSNQPVVCVNWDESQGYCEWAGKRLPTEAEWDKAARGTDGRTFPWGNQDGTCDLAAIEGCPGNATDVCSKSPAGDSPYGLCDMAGNVWERVWDWYGPDYYTNSDLVNPRGPAKGDGRVIRGGSFSDYGDGNTNYANSTRHYRSSFRGGGQQPRQRSINVGFRCAMDI